MKVGHVRPAGTTTRIRLHNASKEPTCGHLAFDDPEELHRGYRIVGVEEVARPGRWNLVLERMTWEAWLEAACAAPDTITLCLTRLSK